MRIPKMKKKTKPTISKLPTKINIGPYRYTIHWVTIRDVHERELGRHDNHECWIKVRTDVASDQMRVTLLHEIMHGVAALQVEHNDAILEEEWISKCSPSLYAVLRDNPKVHKFLFEE
jgi:hypothetical protein